jgi:predicted nuclease with RNAse H fold
VTAVGVDVGARRFHVARLHEGGDIDVTVTSDVDGIVQLCRGASAAAIDAPAEPATGRVHAGEHSPKFAVARCNEIAAGEQLGIWVPWVTPTLEEAPGWMLAGFSLWEALRAAGHAPIEVYPAGCYWLLNGRRWPPKKTSTAGKATRAALLQPYIGWREERSHDALDALMAAVVARGPSRLVGHDEPGCDESRLAVLDVDGRPRGERDVGHAEVVDDATTRSQAIQARPDDVGTSGEHGVLGN